MRVSPAGILQKYENTSQTFSSTFTSQYTINRTEPHFLYPGKINRLPTDKRDTPHQTTATFYHELSHMSKQKSIRFFCLRFLRNMISCSHTTTRQQMAFHIIAKNTSFLEQQGKIKVEILSKSKNLYYMNARAERSCLFNMKKSTETSLPLMHLKLASDAGLDLSIANVHNFLKALRNSFLVVIFFLVLNV